MLQITTSRDWVNLNVEKIDEFLLDHASCERKASGMAMSMVAHYPDRPKLVREMISLAQEELEHFRQVWIRMNERGLKLGPDTKDTYVRSLRGLLRSNTEHYLLDRLVVAGIIEARGHERFQLLADNLPETSTLKSFYIHIARSEDRHARLFIDLAKEYFPDEEVDKRVVEIGSSEAEIVMDLPIRVALH